MSVSSRQVAVAAKMIRLNDNLTKTTESFFEILEDIKKNSIPEIEGDIREFKFETNPRKQRNIEQNIEADLKAVTTTVFAVQKYAREMVELMEQLGRVAEAGYRGKQDCESKMYRARLELSGERF